MINWNDYFAGIIVGVLVFLIGSFTISSCLYDKAFYIKTSEKVSDHYEYVARSTNTFNCFKFTTTSPVYQVGDTIWSVPHK